MSEDDQSFNPELRQVLVVIGKHLIRDQVRTSTSLYDCGYWMVEIGCESTSYASVLTVGLRASFWEHISPRSCPVTRR